MALYTETVMDHFIAPRNVGESPDADGIGEVGNAKCGDIIKNYYDRAHIPCDHSKLPACEDCGGCCPMI